RQKKCRACRRPWRSSPRLSPSECCCQPAPARGRPARRRLPVRSLKDTTLATALTTTRSITRRRAADRLTLAAAPAAGAPAAARRTFVSVGFAQPRVVGLFRYDE